MSKYTPPVLYRCESCGAPIRKHDKYHRLHIKGRVLIFCTICIELSEYRAEEPLFTPKEIERINE